MWLLDIQGIWDSSWLMRTQKCTAMPSHESYLWFQNINGAVEMTSQGLHIKKISQLGIFWRKSRTVSPAMEADEDVEAQRGRLSISRQQSNKCWSKDQNSGLPDPGLVESGSPGSRHHSTSLAYACLDMSLHLHEHFFMISNLGLLTGDGRRCC